MKRWGALAGPAQLSWEQRSPRKSTRQIRRRRFLFFVTFVHLRNALRLSFQMLSSVAKRCKMVSSRVGISREKNCPANPRIQKFFNHFNLLVALLHPIKAQSNQWQWKFNKVYLEQTVPAIPTAFFRTHVGLSLCRRMSITWGVFIQPYWGLLREDIGLTHIRHIFWFFKIYGHHAWWVLHLWYL